MAAAGILKLNKLREIGTQKRPPERTGEQHMDDEKKIPNKPQKGALLLFWLRRKSVSPFFVLAACAAFKREQRDQEQQEEEND